jgi:hypothetical protein
LNTNLTELLSVTAAQELMRKSCGTFSPYGPINQTPGQIAVGPVKVHAWHGVHTEVTLRFERRLEQGIIVFESRTLPENLTDETGATAF